MRTRILTVSICVAALGAVGPAQADAKLWRGKTSQGRAASVRTGGDGVVNRILIKWKLTCQLGTRTGKTVFLPPLDSAGTSSFADAGVSHDRLGGGVRSRDFSSVRGTLGTDGRWRGTYRMHSVLRHGGKVVDRCHVKKLSWRARGV